MLTLILFWIIGKQLVITNAWYWGILIAKLVFEILSFIIEIIGLILTIKE